MSSITSGRRAFPLAITSAFFLLALVGILRHEMWRDEIEIWLIATESSSAGELLRNARTQPHPLLWYLLTWLLSRATSEPIAMQLLSLAIGTATVWTFSRHAPFSKLHRALFSFGYFPLYEYTIISRSYGLDLLLAIVFCALYTRPRRSYPALAATLALLANVHLLGAMIAGILLLLVGWDVSMGERRRWKQPVVATSLAAAGAGIALGAGRVLLGALRMGPEHVQAAPFDPRLLATAFSSVYYAYVPVPDVFTRSFWNTNVLELLPENAQLAVAIALSLALVAMAGLALRRSPPVLVLYGIGTLAMLGVFTEKSSAYLRHQGHLGILVVALLWLDRARRSGAGAGDQRDASPAGGAAPRASEAIPRPARTALASSRLLTLVLALHLVSGAFAYAVDLAYPFSNSKAAARHISEHPALSGATLVGSIDYAAEPVAAHLRRGIFYPDQRSFGTFIDWGPQRRIVRYRQVLIDAGDLARELEQPVLLVLDYDPLVGGIGETCRFADLEVELVASFLCAVVPDENYWLAVVRAVEPQQPSGGDASGGEGAPRRRKRRFLDGRPCISARNQPVGPHVEIPEIRAAEDARRERRRLARLAASAAAGPADRGGDAAPDATAGGSRDERAALERSRQRRARLAAAHQARIREAVQGLKLAACDDSR